MRTLAKMRKILTLVYVLTDWKKWINEWMRSLTKMRKTSMYASLFEKPNDKCKINASKISFWMSSSFFRWKESSLPNFFLLKTDIFSVFLQQLNYLLMLQNEKLKSKNWKQRKTEFGRRIDTWLGFKYSFQINRKISPSFCKPKVKNVELI